MQSKKRSADHLQDDEKTPPQKAPKLFPIFSKQRGDTDVHSSFRWTSPALGPLQTCLHGVNLNPNASLKVAAFDLDGCIIESTIGKHAKASSDLFRWWRPTIPAKLKEAHLDGYAVVIVSNQALRGQNAIPNWKKKIVAIGAALPDVPFHLFAAIAKDGYRKPMPGMWYELEALFAQENIAIDKGASFFVGDAAGRQGDHAGTDRKWALNIGIKFYTPEEYFLKLPPVPFKLIGFNVSSLPSDLALYTPTSTPLVQSSSQELVLYVGYPALGKSSFYRKHFQPENYVHVNQDALKTRNRCIKAVEQALETGQSVIVDNTNRDAKTRKYYVDLAQRYSIPVRCIVFQGCMELAWHNNLYRAYNLPPSAASKEPKREVLPYSAFTSFRSQYEEPHDDEGFTEIKKVNWIFDGDEEERRRWNMWLQIDGK